MLAVAGCCYLRLHSVENPVLDSRQQAWPQVGLWGDGDLVAELAEGSRQHLGTFLLFSGPTSAPCSINRTP